MSKKIISTDNAPVAIGTYSQAVHVGNTVYISGQIPLEPNTMTIIDGDFTARAHQVFKNLKAIANAAGGDLSDIVKLSIYLTDMNNFAVINDTMAQYFSEPYPARAAIGVAQLPKGVDVEMDAIMTLTE